MSIASMREELAEIEMRELKTKIEQICLAEFTSAITELKRENLKPFDQQYHLGRKHAAKDILDKIKNLLEAQR